MRKQDSDNDARVEFPNARNRHEIVAAFHQLTNEDGRQQADYRRFDAQMRIDSAGSTSSIL